MSDRAMAAGQLSALGHKRMSPLKALRLRCIDCCAGSAHEVGLCAARKCPAWPFRLGRNPWIEHKVRSEAQRAATAQLHENGPKGLGFGSQGKAIPDEGSPPADVARQAQAAGVPCDG